MNHPDPIDLVLDGDGHDPLVALAALAQSAGATHLAAEARRLRSRQPDERVRVVQQNHLCRRLAHHLSQLHRALGRSDEECSRTVNAVSILRVMAEIVIDERAYHGDKDRDALEAWLEVERTKFLMATKADAILALDERIAALTSARHERRRAAAVLVREVVTGLLGKFRDRLRTETEKRLADVPRRLLEDVDRSFGELGKGLPLDTVAGSALVMRAFTDDTEGPRPASKIASVADYVGLSSRQRLERTARDELVTALERGTKRAITRILHDYDDMRGAFEHHLCEVIDACLESAKAAGELASRARIDGSDGIARARSRVDLWFVLLTKISHRLV